MRIKIDDYRTSGRRSSWWKHVTNVDTSKSNGYAFDGEFLAAETEYDLPVGSIVIECRPDGSVKNSSKIGYIYEVRQDENELACISHSYDWRGEFLSFRDLVADKINQEPPNPFSDFSNEEILAEAKRRELI
jgi:hypothetical protein